VKHLVENALALLLGAFLIGSLLAMGIVWLFALLSTSATRWLLAIGVVATIIYAVTR
jgi:hypothetical protein